MVIFDSALPGSSASDWASMSLLDSLPALDTATITRLAVVVAHPDDETLGAGGLIALCARQGIPVQVVVVTDGSASHPNSAAVSRAALASIRQRELFLAVAELAPGSEVIMLGFPDGETDEFREQIGAALARAVDPESTIVSTWRGDGHRDHRVVAELCAELASATSARHLEFPIWMWHWAGPDDNRVPWGSAKSVMLSAPILQAKRRAIARHASQVLGVGPVAADGPVLSDGFLANFERDREIFLTSEPADTGGTKSQAYFDGLYAKKDDPWALATRWYETRKRQITLASLPNERYGSALEIGCSTGELSAVLATRCENYLALDISPAAVATAAERTRSLPGVRVEQGDATVRFPDGQFDLVVLSEVGYYWDRETLQGLISELLSHLAANATVVLCHWRHPVVDYPLSGDEANQIARDSLDLHRIAVHDEVDFLLEVYSTSRQSVAAREGMLP